MPVRISGKTLTGEQKKGRRLRMAAPLPIRFDRHKTDSFARLSAMKKKLPEKPVYLALSLLLPLAIQFIALLWLKVTPFGDKTLVISDANGLYINYLAYVGRAVKGLEGFVYSFEKGLGGNMLPNIGITMLDPFFALFALFEVRDYPLAFTLVCVLNLSVCGLSVYLLLAELYGHKRSNLIFSTSYALMGFSVANVFQVFFFSGVQMLPLMALGLRRLLRDRSPCSTFWLSGMPF